MKTLSNDEQTGQPTINGQPATPEQVRELLLQEDGYWWDGQYITYQEQPITQATGKGVGDV